MKLDQSEQRISHAFSQITVDTTNLEAGVKNRLHSGPKSAPRLRFKIAAALAALLVLAAGSVYAAVSLGAFDRFIADHNPFFAEILEPVEIYATDQGIRVEVIGAGQFGNSAIVYLSVQDVSGQNRLTERTWMWLNMSMSMNSSGIYFNRETNTAYFEYIFTRGATNPLRLSFDHIIFNDGYEEVAFPISLVELEEAFDVIYLPSFNFDYLLLPQGEGNFPALPSPGCRLWDSSEGHRQWISNMGIIDGHLHIQTGSTHHPRTGGPSSTVSVELLAPGGMPVTDAFHTNFGTNADFQHHEWANGYHGLQYAFIESIFPINIDELEHYTLTLRNHFRYGTEGNWDVTIYFDDTSGQMRKWEGSADIGEFVLEGMILSPLGIRFTGSFEYHGERVRFGNEIAVETPEGIIPLRPSGGSYFPPRWSFDVFAIAHSPIDAASITAVIVDGVRIVVK
ncbi:MAG: hypothetical protein FWB91_04360 [Defluviitaleaceae bacterium]|nr:hypothetical protein [Defluviitaleaceae bacterium]